jgi:hypothetical protein
MYLTARGVCWHFIPNKQKHFYYFFTLYFIWEFQVLDTYERSAVTSAQTGRRGTIRIKADTSMLKRNVNKWVYTHDSSLLAASDGVWGRGSSS